MKLKQLKFPLMYASGVSVKWRKMLAYGDFLSSITFYQSIFFSFNSLLLVKDKTSIQLE